MPDTADPETPITPPEAEFPVQDLTPGVTDVSGFGATRGTLSSAPAMIGDQFGSSSGALSVIPVPVTPSIHHTFELGGINDLHAIEFLDGDSNLAVFPQGPTGPPFYVLENFEGPEPPLGETVTGLIEGSTGQGPFIALRTDQSATIIDNGEPLVTDATVYLITRPVEIIVPSPSGGSGAVFGRQKISENNSPMPRDRVFFNYSLFHNAPLAPDGIDVHRYTPGFEKTFWRGMASIEARFPFASTLDTDLALDLNNAGALNALPEDVEFGNTSLIGKFLLWEELTWAVSTGLQIFLPTARDVRVSAGDGTPLVDVSNDAVHLAPFLGAVYSDGVFFTQGYVQLDFATDGNRVRVTDFQDGLQPAGRINDATFFYADWGAGYWAYRNSHAPLVTAVAPMVELHWNQSLQETDVVRSGLFQIGTTAENISVLNGLVGVVMQLGGQSTLSLGYATPLGADADREFDGEFRLVFNRYFGDFYATP